MLNPISDAARPYIWAAVIFFAIVALCASFALGWEFRDRSADLVVAQRDTVDANANTKVATEARATDHTNARAATRSEEARVEQSAKHEAAFDTINQEVTDYARAHTVPAIPRKDEDATPAHHGCIARDGADAEFVRIWNEANAGAPDPEPGHPPGADGSPGAHAPAPGR